MNNTYMVSDEILIGMMAMVSKGDHKIIDL